MKFVNRTRWATRPMRSIIARLSNRLGRMEPRNLTVVELKCATLDYSYNRGSRDATIWVPTKNISTFWFARAVDEVLKVNFSTGQRFTHDPRDLRLDNQIRLKYEWAKPFNLVPPPKPKPSLLQKKEARLKAITKLDAGWSSRISAAEKEIRRAGNAKKKLAKERRELERAILKLQTTKTGDDDGK